MKQLGPDTTVILSFDDIVKLSAKNVRFTKFLSSLPVDMRTGPMSSHPVPKAPLDPQRRMALKQSFNNLPAPSKAAIVIDPANVYRAIQNPLEATELDRDKTGLSRTSDVRIDESHTLAVTNPDAHALLTVK